MKRTTLILTITLLLLACEKAEIPVQKPVGAAATIQVEMGADYGNQLFFSIETKEVVRINHRETWDLGFENGESGKHVILNSSKMMSCATTTVNDLIQINSATGWEFVHDQPGGNLDSTAFGSWWNVDVVYILDRGVTVSGTSIGKIKLKITNVNASGYTLEWAPLSSSDIQTSFIPKSGNSNFIAFSFDNNGEIRDIEPPTTDWQLCFTSYTHVYDDGTPYLVTGVLSNRKEVQVAKTSLSFDAITYNDVTTANFEERINVIGYDWKTYDFDLSSYTVDPLKVYLIKTQNDRVFKLRFVDFYTETGVKGAPKFEAVELIP